MAVAPVQAEQIIWRALAWADVATVYRIRGGGVIGYRPLNVFNMHETTCILHTQASFLGFMGSPGPAGADEKNFLLDVRAQLEPVNVYTTHRIHTNDPRTISKPSPNHTVTQAISKRYPHDPPWMSCGEANAHAKRPPQNPVSYTHLTLPTIYSV